MFPCDLYDLLQDFLGIDSSCRVIRVDDNNGLGLICNLALNILNIRIPFGLLIADIVDYISAC